MDPRELDRQQIIAIVFTVLMVVSSVAYVIGLAGGAL